MNNYEIRELLGEGSFGKVKLAIKKWEGFEHKYALKIFKKAKLKRKRELRKDANGSRKKYKNNKRNQNFIYLRDLNKI